MTVQNVKVADTVDTVFPVFSAVVNVYDTVKPEITSVDAVTNSDSTTTFTVNFSEPIAAGSTFKVDGVGANAPYNAGATSVTVTAPNGLAVSSTHTVEVVNLTDLAGNVQAVASKTFSITKDVTAPVVSSVVAQGDNQLLVTFSKNMKNDSDALTNLASNIQVKNDVYSPVGITGVTPVNGTSKTKFIVQLDKTDAAKLFSTTKATHNLTVLFTDNKIEDYLGNKLAGVVKTATITKDTVAPKITGVTYKTNSAGKVTALVVNFSEGLKANDNLAFPDKVVDENGVVQDTTSAFPTLGTAKVKDGDTSAEFAFGTAQTITGKYSVAFPYNWVQDTSLAGNGSDAYQSVINFGNAQTVGTFTIDKANVTNAGTNVIQVVFPEAVKGGAVDGSATDASRYTINGKALPAGTTLTLNAADKPSKGTAAQTILTITLPTGTIDKTDSAAIFTINGVKSLTGKTNVSFIHTLAITDNVSPVLTSAQLLADGQTLVLNYNENLGTVGTNLGGAFKVYVDGQQVTLADDQLVKVTASGKQVIAKITASVPDKAAVPATAKVGGTNASIATVSTGDKATKDATYTYTVANNSGTLEVSDGSTTKALDTSGNGTLTVDGVTVTIKGAKDGDTFTVTTTAPVAGTTKALALDTSKVVTITTVSATDNGKGDFVIEDLEGNNHKANVTVTTTR